MSSKLSLIVTINPLDPPCKVESYAQQWKKLGQTSNVTVLDAAWHSEYLAACTSLGYIGIWRVSPLLDHPNKAVLKRFPVTSNALFFVDFVTTTQNNVVLLVTASHDGIYVYDWKTVLQPSEHVVPPKLYLASSRNKFQHVHLVDSTYLYVATDHGYIKYNVSNGDEIFHVENKHAVDRSALDKQERVVLLGRQDGKLEIRHDNGDHIETLDIATMLHKHTNNNNKSSRGYNHQDKTAKGFIRITGIHVSSPWWVVCGNNDDNGGFLMTLHGPTRSVLSCFATREAMQGMLGQENNHIVTIGNESVVSTWNALDLSRRQGRAWCSPPSCHAVASSRDGLVAVGGVGSTVDVFDETMTKLFSLQVHVEQET